MSDEAPRRGGKRLAAKVIGAFLLVLLLAGAALYVYLLPGLSAARNKPPGIEISVATWLLTHSVPADAKARTNPLAKDAASISAGKDLYAQKCEICHAYDGGGGTEIGPNVYPRLPVLRELVPSLTDGEIFYHIRNGIRNTAMPAWNFPDQQVWQLVSYIRNLPIVASLNSKDVVGPSNEAAGAHFTDQKTAAQQAAAVLGAHYVGSKSCQNCHQDIYARWQKTAMANVLRDPKTHPDAIAADPATAPPDLRFTKEDVAFAYGSKWKQRYWKKSGDTYVPLLAQWNFETKKWSKYHVPDTGDWWAVHYPDPKGDNSTRPTAPLCDGCHSVNFNIDTKQPTEWNVGCEQCHGAGSAHVANPIKFNILNPARQNYVQANDTCIQCHSQGQPLTNPIKGQYYDWAVGYRAGLKLADYWKLEEHKLGETTFTHFPDGTAHKNRMQGNDYVQSLMYTRGVTCFSCHDPHGTQNDAMLRRPINEICTTCHAPNTQNGPHAVSIQAHTHHKPDSPGSQCVACHMPKILPELPGGPFVATHTFHFVNPVQTDAMKIPNACNTCHKDKDTKWATAALAKWDDRSPWRMNQ